MQKGAIEIFIDAVTKQTVRIAIERGMNPDAATLTTMIKAELKACIEACMSEWQEWVDCHFPETMLRHIMNVQITDVAVRVVNHIAEDGV